MNDIILKVENSIGNIGVNLMTLGILIVIAILIFIGVMVHLSAKKKAAQQAGSLKNIEKQLDAIGSEVVQTEEQKPGEKSEAEEKIKSFKNIEIPESKAEAKEMGQEEETEEQDMEKAYYNTGKSGRIYSREELELQIKE